MTRLGGTDMGDSIDVGFNWEKSCSACGEEYVNIGHPLKPGVVMMRDCACVRETETLPASRVTITSTRAPTPDERAEWRRACGRDDKVEGS